MLWLLKWLEHHQTMSLYKYILFKKIFIRISKWYITIVLSIFKILLKYTHCRRINFKTMKVIDCWKHWQTFRFLFIFVSYFSFDVICQFVNQSVRWRLCLFQLINALIISSEFYRKQKFFFVLLTSDSWINTDASFTLLK
jgi:hypothetical protein